MQRSNNKVCLSPKRGLPGEGQSRLDVARGQTTTATTKYGDELMRSLNKYVVLDVHKDTRVIAVAEDGRTREQRVNGPVESSCTR